MVNLLLNSGASLLNGKPVVFLTQWKIVGNSTVHTDEYLTQWKVEGNSVVDNNAILSCGDLGQDGKYHVKISNGVTIYDIPLTEPLRKVNDVADSIEFADGVATLTRLLKSVLIGGCTVARSNTNTANVRRWALKGNAKIFTPNVISTKYAYNNRTYYCNEGINADSGGDVQIFDSAYTSVDAQTFKAANADVEILFELATPTTETIQVSPFPVSPTDTYTSANVTPYSAFEYKKNVEIWSCGEYSAVDGKYHILVQPLGGSIADIALDEPLRKVNGVADTIEFVNGVATLTRNINSILLKNAIWEKSTTNTTGIYRWVSGSIIPIVKTPDTNLQKANILCSDYSSVTANNTYLKIEGISVQTSGYVSLYNDSYNQEGDKDSLILSFGDAELLYTLTTPTTEVIQAPQIQEAESYSCVISQGAKAVEWSNFETD